MYEIISMKKSANPLNRRCSIYEILFFIYLSIIRHKIHLKSSDTYIYHHNAFKWSMSNVQWLLALIIFILFMLTLIPLALMTMNKKRWKNTLENCHLLMTNNFHLSHAIFFRIFFFTSIFNYLLILFDTNNYSHIARLENYKNRCGIRNSCMNNCDIQNINSNEYWIWAKKC